MKEVDLTNFNKQQIADFQLETNILSQLKNKSIVKLHSIYNEKNTKIYLVSYLYIIYNIIILYIYLKIILYYI